MIRRLIKRLLCRHKRVKVLYGYSSYTGPQKDFFKAPSKWTNRVRCQDCGKLLDRPA